MITHARIRLAPLPILIADPSETLRRTLRRVLASEGYEIVEAKDAATTVDLCFDLEPGLLIVDATAPGAEGEEILRAVRAEFGDASPPVLLMTASERQCARAAELGASEALLKPFGVEHLLAAVERHLVRTTSRRIPASLSRPARESYVRALCSAPPSSPGLVDALAATGG